MDILLLFLGGYFIAKNRFAFAFTILICLFTSYYQLGTNMSTTIVSHNVSDSGFVLFFALYVKGKLMGKNYSYIFFSKLRPFIYSFVVFLIVSIIIDLGRGVDFLSILKTSRHWLVLIFSIPLLSYFSVDVYHKTVKYILYVTLCISAIILSDHYLGTNLMNREASIFISNTGIDYTRGAIPSTFASFYILLLLTGYFKNIKKRNRYLYTFLLFMTIVASLIRSMIIAQLIGIVFIAYKLGYLKLKNIGYVLVGFCVLFFILSSNDGLIERMTSGKQEMLSFSKGDDNVNGNMAFRLLMFQERAEYVSRSLDRTVFGVGNVIEENFPTVFRIGLYDSSRGAACQLDTADIAWSLLVLRLGFVGLFIFMMIWIKTIGLLRSEKNHMAISLHTFLLISILIAFCSSIITSGTYWFFLLMLVACSIDKQTENKSKNYL